MTDDTDDTDDRDNSAPVDNDFIISMTVNDAAAAVGLSRGSLYKAMAAGQLRSIWLAGRRLILRADLVNFVNGAPPRPEDRP